MHRLTLLLAALLLFTACSPATPSSTAVAPDPAQDYPVVITTGAGEVTIATRPQRIVSLSASATETLFAIGAGDQVVATDSFSTHPAAAPTQDDLLAFAPNVEAIVTTYAPDLVILAFDPGDVVAAFGALGIPVIVHPTAGSFTDAYAQWEQLGAATGHLADAVALVNEVQDAINEAVASVDGAGEGITFYHELDATLYTVTSTTFVGEMYDRFGMTNIADPADPDGWGYPQLSPEYVIDTSPQAIFHTNCCGDSLSSMAARPGWGTIAAVRSGHVFELDDDIASRWGPRMADFAWAVAAALTSIGAGDA